MIEEDIITRVRNFYFEAVVEVRHLPLLSTLMEDKAEARFIVQDVTLMYVSLNHRFVVVTILKIDDKYYFAPNIAVSEATKTWLEHEEQIPAHAWLTWKISQTSGKKYLNIKYNRTNKTDGKLVIETLQKSGPGANIIR